MLERRGYPNILAPAIAPTHVAGRVALLVNAFASGNLDDLPIATEDA
jgi:hypothetical protein